MKTLLTCEEAAERLGIHVSTIRAWIRQGRIPAYKLGQRFLRVDLVEVLSTMMTEHTEPVAANQPRLGREVGDDT